ncbi:hypothetical protein ABVK25_010420 [Lepraria finkii]|uniref:Uncharacterized protein n=1 Tax=Lepraria finkii TaxID=1340010 RepID=A0ABR4AW06_9LECA
MAIAPFPPNDPTDPPQLLPDERLELAYKRWKEDKTVPVYSDLIASASRPPLPRLSSAETPPSYPTTRCFSSAKTSKNSSEVTSQGDYTGPIPGPVGAASPRGELRGASGSTNGKRTTYEKAS